MNHAPTGIIPAVPTPFNAAGAVDHDELRRLLEFLIQAGVHGLFMAGNAGEFYALTEDEKRAVLETSLRAANGRVPVIFGAGAATTDETLHLTRMAEATGAQAISLITPYLVKPSAAELYDHFKTVTAATRLPVLVYNNPALTGVTVTPALMTRLAREAGMAGVKDSSGDLAVTLGFLRIDRPGFAVFAGRDGLILATLAHGGAGAISSVAAACPEKALAIYAAFQQGDLDAAARHQMTFAALRELFTQGTFPSVLKAMLHIRGFKVGAPRPPVAALSAEKYRLLAEALEQAGIQAVK